jgi:hypothetical protein
MRRAAGSSTVPVWGFVGDDDTGIARAAADELSLITGGVQAINISSNQDVSIATRLFVPTGTAALPSLTLGPDLTGFYQIDENAIGYSTAGTARFSFGTSGITSLVSGAARMSYATASSTVPGHNFFGDIDTGIGRAAADELSLIAGGVESVRITTTATTFMGNVFFDGSAYFTGTETIDVSSSYIHLNTGLTGTPSAAMQAGVIAGRGDENPYVFIYDESNKQFRIGEAPWNGTQYDDASTQAVATREDTPFDTGIPIWDDTLDIFRTDTSLYYSDAGDLSVSPDTDSTTILGRTIIDSRIADNMFISHYDMTNSTEYALRQTSAGLNLLNAPATQNIQFRINNQEKWRLDTDGSLVGAGGNINMISGGSIDVSTGSASLPSITFGEEETGFFLGAAGTVSFTSAGVREINMNSAAFYSSSPGKMQIATSQGLSNTAPVYTFLSDTDTGYTSSAADTLSLIAGGQEGIRITEDASIHVDIFGTLDVSSNIINGVYTDSASSDASIGGSPVIVGTISNVDYDTAFFKYKVIDASSSNLRAGRITAIWSGVEITHSEEGTADLGDTSYVTFDVSISGTDTVLLATATSDDWTIKTIINGL